MVGDLQTPEKDVDATRELFMAVDLNRGDLIVELIARLMTPDVRDSHGRTPLMVAALRGHREAYETLRASGASLKAIDVRGVSVMDYVKIFGSVPVGTVNVLKSSISKAYVTEALSDRS